MGLWSAMSASWNAPGMHSGNLPFHPNGPRAALMGMKIQREGLLHNMRRGVMEMAGIDNAGMGRLASGQRYGGGIFSPGGWKEILHDVRPVGKNLFETGARRTLKGSLGKFAGKAIFPAMFAYQMATQGVGAAVRDNVVSGAVFGAARWGITKLGMGLFNPVTLGVAALVGGVAGGREALIAGRKYRNAVRETSFGTAANDSFGTMATMRQASLQAIQSSRLNGRSALGGEASLMHS